MNASLDDAHERLLFDDEFIDDFWKRHREFGRALLTASVLDRYVHDLQEKVIAAQDAFAESVRDHFRD